MVNYGKECKKDDECKSKLCEMTYVNGAPDTRRCVIQQLKYGKLCNYNKDCDSNRCVRVYNNNGNSNQKRCAIINGQVIPNRDWETNDENDPEFMRSDAWQNARNQEFLISNTQKRIIFQGRGPVTDIIVLCMEIAIYILKEIWKFIMSIWKMIFFIISIPFSFLYTASWDGFSKKYYDTDTGQCKESGIKLEAKTLTKLITILFPPLGVFIDRGLSGIGHIMVTSLLSAMFYFPGMIYGLMLVDDTLCPNSIELFTGENYKGKRFIFSYGDYNYSDSRMQELNTCGNTAKFQESVEELKTYGQESGWAGASDNEDTEHVIPDGQATISSIRVGKNVKVRLYADNKFKEYIGSVQYHTENVENISINEPISISDTDLVEGKISKSQGLSSCLGKLGIKGISIRLLKPLELSPKKIDDNSIVLYLLLDFRGQHLILQEGDYDYDELKIFNNRISSVRIGKNMKVKLFQHKHYNKKMTFRMSAGFGGGNKTMWISSQGREAELHGDKKYDTENDGEVTNISTYGLNNMISSMMIKKIDDSF